MIGTTAGGFHSPNTTPGQAASQCASSARRVSTTKRSRPPCSAAVTWRLEIPPANSAPASGRRSFHREMPSIRAYVRPPHSTRRSRKSQRSRDSHATDVRWAT
jgi:hypothetical protein